uniref:Uncharacterized protein n=1 Tax=Romanomermis culicivorax TaxID=13658 RepID=A0A915KK84_ROMCU
MLDASKQRHLKGELSQSSSSSSLAAAAGGVNNFGVLRAARQSQENLRVARSHAAAPPP